MKNKKELIIAAAIVLLALLIGIIVFALRSRGKNETPDVTSEAEQVEQVSNSLITEIEYVRQNDTTGKFYSVKATKTSDTEVTITIVEQENSETEAKSTTSVTTALLMDQLDIQIITNDVLSYPSLPPAETDMYDGDIAVLRIEDAGQTFITFSNQAWPDNGAAIENIKETMLEYAELAVGNN